MGPDGPHLLERDALRLAVRTLTAADTARWDAFVAACPEATFFHRAGWKTVIERAFGHRTHYLFAERDGTIVGVLPLTEIKSRLFGHALISNAFCVYGGIAATDEDARQALDTHARALARQLCVGHLEYRNLRPFHRDWPTQDLYYTFRKEIAPDVETNLKAIPRKQRAMVRKGMKHGLKAEFDGDVERFYALFADNVHRHGTPALPRRYFALLKEVFGADCDVLIVTHAGRPVSGVLTFWFRDEVLPYYAGDVPVARELAANDFKYWALMRHACERGYRVFDYGRSKRGTGQFDFKKNWGFEPQPLHYEYDLVRLPAIPQHNPANPKYRLFIALWKRLPLPVANALGPAIVKNLG
ncbi:FemAB family XrtA/PEP-CTERM system-associated protein [Thiobacter aerophilum]|uniref:FemAB family XrtA/PEP-CTERM system-associated protein n=1 Tax=Thiobacter aerophilum TaxID=3121275 RepID=A0ABV0EFD7_9BURK